MLKRIEAATRSFDPFKRQKFDRRNQEIYALHQQGVTMRELAQRFGLSEKRVWGICTAMRKMEKKGVPGL